MIWERLAEVEKGRRLRGLRQIRRGGDQPAHGSGLADVAGCLLGTEGRSMRHHREYDANRKNEQSCPGGRCSRPSRWRPGIHLPVTTVFVRRRWQPLMASPAPMSSTRRPSGARAQAARNGKAPHRAGLPDGKAGGWGAGGISRPGRQPPAPGLVPFPARFSARPESGAGRHARLRDSSVSAKAALRLASLFPREGE